MAIPAFGPPPAWLLYGVLYAVLLAIGFLIERRPDPWRRGPLFIGLSAVGFIAGIVMFGVYGPTLTGGAAFDVVAYWNIDLRDPYPLSFGQLTELRAFRSAPPMAFLL